MRPEELSALRHDLDDALARIAALEARPLPAPVKPAKGKGQKARPDVDS